MKSLLALILVIGLAVAGVYGVRTPYRNVFTALGSYQLEAFETGLAFYHFGNSQTFFYAITPLNDFLVVGGVRTTLLSKEDYDTKHYVAVYHQEKPDSIVETINQYLGRVYPYYTLTVNGMQVAYSSEKVGSEIKLTREITLPKPMFVDDQGITIWYYDRDIVVDLGSETALTTLQLESAAKLNELYGLKIKENYLDPTDTASPSGAVGLVNPARPGMLVIKPGLNQQVRVNRSAHLIEVVSPINQTVNKIEETIFIGTREAR